jgi:putative FmdB family regulatory protein
MPLYEYQCEHCGVRFERLQRKRDPRLKQCPECKGPLRRLIQPPRIIFKGSGFYVTDNRRSGVGTQRSSTDQTSETGKESSETKETQKDSD